ncbi:hypothetical protein ThrDRAFT_02124 [Frankia casuarinae]|nr:hypothetical protein CcI6DRAFT_00015 [Frankia sp. CcI6]EYT92166.1 hypothetical protein ThrDRAFT_02124 [Frankia casuarinae]KDA45080.1 hypothetical protein BMG523Draft_00209 [Frankia sp. BMG5.23]KEZ38250.1 hypothetical protein CEDDRAFT_00583 [Frankia sp. CeD]KFB06704.1 hypothetical protein ALLO2DRAFT_00751 [Frankia sp. Allo2]
MGPPIPVKTCAGEDMRAGAADDLLDKGFGRWLAEHTPVPPAWVARCQCAKWRTPLK